MLWLQVRIVRVSSYIASSYHSEHRKMPQAEKWKVSSLQQEGRVLHCVCLIYLPLKGLGTLNLLKNDDAQDAVKSSLMPGV